MHFSTGPSKSSWQPVMAADTTHPDYWLNWRVSLCGIWVLSCVIIAFILIWKYEGSNSVREDRADTRRETLGTLYMDESWRPCLQEIHPAWLLAFRVTAFFVLLALLVVNAIVNGGDIFYYYTQWTFVLVTVYFGLGSLLSVYGCHQYLNKVGADKPDPERPDAERGTFMAPTIEENPNMHGAVKISGFHEEDNTREIAGFWGYVFQIIYQTNAGAVMLTDCVFWLIIFPFLAIKDYNLNFLLIGMHSVNAVFLLADTALNSSRFPWFRIAYFLLWTAIYVIFQWVVHACISIWWPYPFLDLSSPHAPIWYFVVALMHIPCYAVFPLIIKLKHILLSRWFPRSYHGMSQLSFQNSYILDGGLEAQTVRRSIKLNMKCYWLIISASTVLMKTRHE
uniref:Uncharacterized protein LOC105058816 n=1 Tax=Elaeis guineensis var. tenera TaxID=51953 RepID=A0A8N4FBE8_ELAGV|nr:uncharacterized protein LOC105058816 [Elaeis guineensis]